jgi:hypothetical protein
MRAVVLVAQKPADRFARNDQRMTAMKKVALPLALLLSGALSGCATGPQFFCQDDPNSCHEPGSDAWWSEKAMLPPGVRAKCKKGKVWPPRPRSTQEKQQFCHTYYSEHYWPLPYVCQDRQAVQDFIQTQTALGWQEETTLYDRHFDPITQTLTQAGELHLEYILHVVPPERRLVYIQSTYDAIHDGTRTESVTLAMSRMGTGSADVPVSVRECQQVGRPAAEVQAINAAYAASTPSPRLSSASGGGGGAASGGGASGGAAAGGGTQ